jgi:hypothetical protein
MDSEFALDLPIGGFSHTSSTLFHLNFRFRGRHVMNMKVCLQHGKDDSAT